MAGAPFLRRFPHSIAARTSRLAGRGSSRTPLLQTHEYKNLTRWTKEIGERPAVKRGRMVNRTSGRPEEQLRERHDASDFATKTQDKIAARG